MSEDVKKPAAEAANDSGDDKGMRRGYADKDAGTPTEPRFKGRRRRKVSYLTINKIEKVDFKEVNILRRFTNDRGKILPSRQTGATAKQQRMIAEAIRRAREMALMPFVVRDFPQERTIRPQRPRYDRSENREPREHREPREPREQAPAPAAE